MTIEYPLNEGYKFSDWYISTKVSGYNINTTNSGTKTTLSIQKNSVTYFTLQFDRRTPTTATITSIKAINKGSNDYAFTIYVYDELLPKITSTTPVYSSSGIECDTPIEITFNTDEIDCDTIELSSTGTIQIVNPANESEHYEKYFEEPEWDGDYTLKILPKSKDTYTLKNGISVCNYDGIRNLVPKSGDVLNLKVKIIYQDIEDCNGNSLQKDYSWTYRINHDMEQIPPQAHNMKLFKPKYNPQEVPDEYVELKNTAFTSFGSTAYSTNHIKDKIYFSIGSITDEGSGYKKMTLQETLIKTVEGTTVEENCNPVEYTASSFDKELYELQSEMDGVIQLDFKLEDYAGAINTISYYVIKDTSLEATTVLNPKVTNFIAQRESKIAERGTSAGSDMFAYTGIYSFYKKLSNNAKTSFDERKTDDSDIVTETIEFDSDKARDVFYNKSSYGKSSATYNVEYGYSADSINNSATKVNSNKFTFDRDSTKDCYIRITAYDAVGNTGTMVRVIPRRVMIVDMSLKSSPSNYNFDSYYAFDISDKDTLNTLAKNNNALDARFLLIYKFKPKGSDTFSEDIYFAPTGQGTTGSGDTPDGVYYTSKDEFYLENNSFTDETLTPDGTYYFYVIPYLRYTDRRYYGAASKTPYVYYHNVEAPSPSGTPTFGEYTATIKPAELSTGKRDVVVSTNFEKDSGYTYGVRYNVKDETDYKYADFSFSVPSGYNYELCLYAKNDATN